MADPLEDWLASSRDKDDSTAQVASGALFRRLHVVAALVREATATEDGPRLLWREAERTREFHLRADCVLGRTAECQVIFDGPGVSRRHCAITLRDGAVQLTDLGSTNGTFVNGRRIAHHRLCSGDLIEVGVRVVVFLEG